VSKAEAPRRIRELPDELISQIAAGEVVERPASVLRELLDNALDAGARQIAVRLTAGGVRAIALEDDGCGIARAELPLALRRHATSKIASLHDLENVATLGFRGEALAAIASVSDTCIISRTADGDGSDSAWRLDARSGELRPAARSRGTTVQVNELFFSTPARRKFLKSEATELAHCLEAVRRQALARPDVGFAIWHNGKLLENWPAAGDDAAETAAYTRRLAAVLGADFVRQALPVHYDSAALCIHGLAGLPDMARARADQQFCYVNRRFVRDKVLMHAARQAYEDVLHGQRQPVYVLYVQIAPQRVDVNVHPTKIEVRFRDSHDLHRAVRQARVALPGGWPAHVHIHERGFCSQAQFDEMLWASDCNIVRGEDSLVRALWAGQPFVWNIYPQSDQAHHAKLHAFLDWLQAPASLRAAHCAFNGLQPFKDLPAPDSALLHEWQQCVQTARARLLAQPPLGAQLLDFACAKWRNQGGS